jgi:hypothetical protein
MLDNSEAKGLRRIEAVGDDGCDLCNTAPAKTAQAPNTPAQLHLTTAPYRRIGVPPTGTYVTPASRVRSLQDLPPSDQGR